MKKVTLVDTECRQVRKFYRGIFEDPMSKSCGCLDDVIEGWNKKHLKECERCRDFATLNPEME